MDNTDFVCPEGKRFLLDIDAAHGRWFRSCRDVFEARAILWSFGYCKIDHLIGLYLVEYDPEDEDGNRIISSQLILNASSPKPFRGYLITEYRAGCNISYWFTDD